jgi:short subunit dehydrogenase-like uncharacterized protein
MSVFNNSEARVRGAPASKTIVPFLLSLCIGTPVLLCIFVPTVIIFKIFGWMYSKICGGAKKVTHPDTQVHPKATLPVNPRANRKYDVVVYGATGYTGGLLAGYFSRQYSLGKSLRWAIGGRSLARLEAVRDELVKTNPEMRQLDLVVADSHNFEQLSEMCNNTKVVCSTVGPYTLYGSTLVNACALYGTDYTDITGELDWVRDNVACFQKMALKSGARIVSFCGHDCIPWDITAQQLADKLKKDHNQSVKVFNMWDNIKGTASGGTIATVFELYERRKTATPPKKIPREENEFYMVPGETVGSGFMSKNLNTKMLSYDSKAKSWVGLFVMADANMRIVDRSNALLGWGNGLKYSEKMIFSNFMVGYSYYLGILFLACALECSLIGWFFRNYVLPKPGQGPNEHELQTGFLNVYGEATGENGAKVNSVMTFNKDPGYWETARMLGESGLCFVFDNDKLKVGGGMHTTASGLGQVLLDRLVATGTGFRFYDPRDEKVKAN